MTPNKILDITHKAKVKIALDSNGSYETKRSKKLCLQN